MSIIRKISLLCLALLSVFVSHPANAGTTTYLKTDTCSWPEVKPLKEGSEISTYTFHYWDFVKKEFKQIFPAELNTEGTVIGDYHFQNVTAFFNTSLNKMDLAVADFDDVGVAPLYADLMKFFSFLKTKEKNIFLDSIIKNYIKGLNEKTHSNIYNLAPSELKTLLKQNMSWALKKQKEYVDGKIKNTSSKFQPQEGLQDIKNLPSRYYLLQIDTLSKIEREGEVLDSGFTIHSSGSSVGMLRLQYLTYNSQQFKIYELKQTRCPGTQLYKPQLASLSERILEASKIFDSYFFWKETKVIPYMSDHFILKEKTYNPLKFIDPKKINSVNMQEYANYFSYLLGFYHSKTAKKEYVVFLSSLSSQSLSELAQRSELFSKKYLQKLKNDLRKNEDLK